MRVLGGVARGRRLRSVPGATTRPPLSRVRQALFNIVQHRLPGASWLDLFAGTGSFGIEALSRGAATVVFVELSPKAVEVIGQNLALTGLEAGATVIRGDVLQEVPRLARIGYRFTVVGIAPPYFRELGPRALGLVDESGIVAPEGCVYVQSHRSEAIPDRTASLIRVRVYRYGETVLSLYVPAIPR